MLKTRKPCRGRKAGLALILSLLVGNLFPAEALAASPGGFFGFLTPHLSARQEAALPRLPGFQTGATSGDPVYILFRPNCPHCHALWDQMQMLKPLHPEYFQRPIFWIPVVVTDNDARKLSAVWSGTTVRTAKALRIVMTETLTQLPPLSPGSLLRMQTMTAPALAWLKQTGAQSVPAIIVEHGGTPAKVHLGDPVDATLLRWLKGSPA